MAYLILSNGDIFEGERFGDRSETVGELVFTTGMVGYLETLTDPSYAGQIVIQTFPLIGNYGVIEEDFEGEPALRGYVVREWCPTPSNFRSRYALDEFLASRHIPGLFGVDTRQLTRIIRENGVMNAMICDRIPDSLEELKAFAVKGAVESVTCASVQHFEPQGKVLFRVALLDYGYKRNIVRSLCERGCAVDVFPADTKADKILSGSYDGLMLSNGPGDPADNKECIKEISKIVGKMPIFGICLGHQLTALAMGGRTVKLKYGHRGGNQPVRMTDGTRTFITCQNHGYAVDAESLAGVGHETFVNANDGSCEGMDYPGLDCFTVQFHPEACAGPHDTSFLFDKFTAMMGGKEHAAGSKHP
ncbi:MAG: glutamine-hydrolyzing carbamoyl-phosphate synthase small subunit [Clostridia bacterium]|nr:glutamine-hydrolyzing carbamoyl-phosphate synthase small subunit [Clostridia bacterium]